MKQKLISIYKRMLTKYIITPMLGEFQDRLTNYHRNRWDAIDNLADYLVGAEIPGDFLEFGVAQGATFSYACRTMAFFKHMRFIAVDSFEGLPEPSGIDTTNGYTAISLGAVCLFRRDFLSRLKRDGIDMARVITVKGWFDHTLTNNKAKSYGIDGIAAAWIDCDLYESTVPVLRFLTSRISVGTVILFDDWRCFRNLPDFRGTACLRHEWLLANPQIKLHELFSFGWHGMAFTVGSC
ncbi:MAG: TylF/MycF family methyltransferase [Candidatus Moduliflexus flocculans]|nr:TylF/MycF family methyltransferase [Candidatus Moduliflexus flocculans]